MERSPTVLEVVVRKGSPFIEVYLKAMAPINCYDVREYSVRRDTERTIIVPVLRNSQPGKDCGLEEAIYEDKVADLDPTQESAYEIEVLGYRGWHSYNLNRPE